MRVHVVLAQVYPNGSETGVIGDALPKLEALAVQAAEDGADVIVFPEYFLSGATHHAWHSVRALPALEGHAVAPWVGEVAEIAAKAKIAIVTGSAVQLRSFGNKDEQRLYNTTYFLDRTGTLCGAYTKRNLWHAERDLLTQATKQSHPEDEQPALFVFTTARGLRVRAAMVMCWDLMFPESFRRLMNPQDGTVETADLDQEGRWIGPDIVFAPTCWFADDSGPKALAWNPNCEAACLNALTVCRAMENECYVCMCNAAGSADASTPPVGLGLSSCNAPLLGCEARVEHANETLLYQSLDLRVLDTARGLFRIGHDLHNGVVRLGL